MAKKRDVSKYFDFSYVEANIHDGDSIQELIQLIGAPHSKSLVHTGPQFEYSVIYTWNFKAKDKVATLICNVKQGFNIIVRHEYTEVYVTR